VENWSGPKLAGGGIGHTRWATHGAVNEQNAHPHTDCSGRISVVHNGIIENADTLREALRSSGHRFTSSVDSEVICHLIEDQLSTSNDLHAAVQAAMTPLEGSWALGVLEQHTGRVVIAAHRSPLLIAHTSHGDIAASDIAAVVDWVDEFRVLEDGEVIELGTGQSAPIHSTSSDRMITRCVIASHDVELNGYVDYMAKEIDEQPLVAARVIDELAGGVVDGTLWRDLELKSFDRLRVIGCGTSLNAGHVVANMVRRVGGIPTRLTVASEASEEISESRTLCLAISQSGETADVLQAVRLQQDAGSVLALTNNMYSTLARCADAYLSCVAGMEVSVAATKTFVCQVIAGSAVMISALVATGRLSKIAAAVLVDDLKRLPDKLAAASTVGKCLIPPLVEELVTANGFIFISRGVGLPYAAEGALKLKELTYRWAEHYPAGELKHGPLALVSEGTPVVSIDSGNSKLASNVAEVTSRGGRVISIGGDGSDIPVLSDGPAPWGPLESVVPMQILARTLGLALGCDVDKPRNLAKSVTVE
jgi:glucosamine--fructose-6-phosphate aminotransferase (isomerizing)